MPNASRLGTLGMVTSVALHAGVFWGLTEVPTAPTPVPLASVVEFELPPVADEEPRTLESPSDAGRDPMPEEPAPRALIPTSLPSDPSPAADPKHEPEPAVARDLTGLTLTNDSGSSGWASQVGNGQAITTPLRTPRKAQPASQSESVTTKRVAHGPSVVPLADLSTRPVPPKLDSLLEQHYPTAARLQGKSGNAIVRLRIDSDGKVRLANVVSESDPGFGRACRTTVLGSEWSPPRDNNGKRVATFVSYTCRFRAER